MGITYDEFNKENHSSMLEELTVGYSRLQIAGMYLQDAIDSLAWTIDILENTDDTEDVLTLIEIKKTLSSLCTKYM